MNYAFYLSAPLIATALLIDFWAGDPLWMPHPVRLIGAVISLGERILRTGDERRDLQNGGFLALATIALSGGCGWLVIAGAYRIAEPIGVAVAVLIAWTTLALRGLDDAGRRVEQALESNDEALARSILPALVGRDPETLDRAGMIRATIESVAENTSDGVIAPLLFLFAGGPVAALAYKAVNTLDSMIGYRDQRYLFFGRTAARIDDVANYLPARLTAICLMAAAHLITGRASQAWKTCRADARSHASPNAGFPEAAIAGALGIQLGGDVIYGGEVEHRTQLGRPGRAPNVTDIAATRALMRIATATAFCLLTVARSMIVTAFA